jgi:quinol monooxygenase YgiN
MVAIQSHERSLQREALCLIHLLLSHSFQAKPDQAEELGRRLCALVAPTRAESGCINYDLHRSNDDPTIWMLYENWRSEPDLEKHFQTAPFKEFVARSHEVLAGEMELRRFSMRGPLDFRAKSVGGRPLFSLVI